MPGAKRRALKKLLSPNSTPSSEPTSGASLAPVDSAQSGASMSSIASDSRNYMTDAELDNAQNVKTELDRMEMRKDSIGSGASGMNIPAPGAAGGVPPLGEDGQGLPPAVADAPTLEGEGDLLAVPSLSHTANANGTSTLSPAAVSTSPSSASLGSSPLGAAKGLYGKMMGHGHGSNGNGNGNDDASEGDAASGAGGGGKKKSSKQKFAERQARKQQAMLEQAPPSNPNWDKQLEKERLDEVRVVGDACVALGRMIHEVCGAYLSMCMCISIRDVRASVIGVGRVQVQEAQSFWASKELRCLDPASPVHNGILCRPCDCGSLTA